jgi:hypothetical protein
VSIAKSLYELNVPESIIINSYIGLPFLAELKDINLGPIVDIDGSFVKSENVSLNDYKNPVLRWQSENILANISTEEFLLKRVSGETEGIFRTYNIDVKSDAFEEGYFVINRPFEEVHFVGDSVPRKSDNVPYLIVEPGEELSFEFYYLSSEETRFFVSPRLSNIILEEDIDESCNNNLICEPGEDYKTCRSDCKPVALGVIYIILAVFIILIIYTLLQMWYKVHYENYLFGGDRKQLFNILMYITNARSRSIRDRKISQELKKQGWSVEKVNYVMKKSRGDRTGLYEIIPVEKIKIYFRNHFAKKKIATNTGQQSGRNINKYAFRRSSGVRE